MAPGKTLALSQSCAIAASGFHVEFIDSAELLSALTPQWQELWSTLPDATPFQSPDWLLTWWRHYGEDHPLFSFAFWKANDLIGLAPLYIYASAVGIQRRVVLLGTGNTDYLDVMFQDKFRDHCWRLLLDEIERHAALWDECDFQRLRASSPLLRESAYPPGLRTGVRPEEPCPVVDLRGCAAGPMLKRASYYSRKLREIGAFTIEDANENSVDELLAALERLHEQRWRAKGMPGVLSCPADRSFHRQVAAAFVRSKILMLRALRIDAGIVAVLYGFQHGARAYFYLGGFHPEYARQSVSTVLLGHTIEAAAQAGCQWFDFLKGREEYKYRWGATDQLVFARRVTKAGGNTVELT